MPSFNCLLVAISVTQRHIFCKMGPVHCKLASQTAHQFSFSFRQHNFVFNQKRKISKMKATQSE